jgi:hypothetical protein
MTEILAKKKRGRKPKNFNVLINKNDTVQTASNINSEEENVIFHLPITINEINNKDTEDCGIFIKSENDINHLKITEDNETSESVTTTMVMTQNNSMNTNNSINKIMIHILNFTKNTKCWWCRNIFNTPPVQLPEDFYNDTFYCIGHFCSYNCMKSHNLDLNDSLSWKRESLMNLLYYKTYSEYKEIVTAPHWMTLEEYGGTLSILKFRENSVVNNKEYIVLHPPLISRQMQIEESYKLNKLKEVPIDKLNKIYSEIESEYKIKRSKPVKSNQLNLETTMGLIKSKKKF